MKIREISLVSPELLAKLERLAKNVALGIRDPEEMRKAAERMDHISKEIRLS
jgi:hypothetical protein